MNAGDHLLEGRCAHVDDRHRRCDQAGTHRVVLLLRDPDRRWVKKIVLAVNDQPHLRCPAHQERRASAYFDHALWSRMASSYAIGVQATGHEARASRDLTIVQFEPIDMAIGSIPIYAARPDGRLEVIAKARVIK